MNHLYNPAKIRLPPGLFSSVPQIFAHILEILMVKKELSTVAYLVVVVTEFVSMWRNASGPN